MITGTERWAVLGTTEEEGGQCTCIHKHIHVRARPDDRQVCHYANGSWKALHNVCSLSRPARGFGELEGKSPLDLKAWNNRKNRSKPLPLLSEMLPLDSVGESGEGLSRKKTPESGRCEGKDSLWVIRRFLWKKNVGEGGGLFQESCRCKSSSIFCWCCRLNWPRSAKTSTLLCVMWLSKISLLGFPENSNCLSFA